MSEPFYKRMWRKPPVIFPWIGLFHVGMLLYLVGNTITDPVYGWILMQPVLMLLYTIFWLYSCDLKKWAALSYMGLTTLNLLVRFLVTDKIFLNNFTDTIFPADMMFTFFVMYYFKKFE